MAKNLKINVKNSQLSQVLKGIRQKKGESSELETKDSETEAKTVESPITEKPAPKKVSRAKKPVAAEAKETPVAFDEPAIEKTKPIIESHPKEERLSKIEKEIFKEEVLDKSFEDEVPTKTEKPASSFEQRAQRSIEPHQRTTRPSFSSERTSKPSGFQPKSMSFEKPTEGYQRSSYTTGPRYNNNDQPVSGRAEPRITSSYSTERRYQPSSSPDSQTEQGAKAADQTQSPAAERRAYPPREGQERRSYPPRDGSERSSYPPREGQERRSYPPRDGSQRSSYPPREGQERRPYPPREGGERRPYTPREGGERGSYPPREGQERRPYPPREGGERGSYPPREGQERRPYPPREGGERRPYTPREGGERRPYPPRDGARPGFGPRPQGSRPPFQRPSFAQGTSFPPLQTDAGSRRSLPPTKKGPPLKEEEKKKRRLNEPSKHFDSRDRHGLRGDEDEFHRRKFKTHISKSHASEEILRPKAIAVTLPISVKDLASEMKLKAVEVIAKLLTHGIKCMLNDMLDDEIVVQLVGQDFGCEISIDTSKKDRMDITGKSIVEEIKESDLAELSSRPPVVTFMGHVDHGKTSLIDALRKSNLASKEAGAITQHIGAFSCHTANGDITILDTPGHEAFTTIRSRGASVTDIVVLVVAGDEGFKVQTDEAIRIAKEAKLPMIFALNKMDKEGFDPEKVYRQMADRELLPEAWGGEVPTVNCSALTGDGIPELTELLALQSEILELKANPQSRARGTVLESQIIKGLGPSATLLIQNGTLRISDAIVFGEAYARVKTIQDEHGKALKSAGPSHAVRVTGLSDVPSSGSEFIVVKSEKEARKICEQREAESSKSRLRKQTFNLGSMLQANAMRQEKKILNVIVRADVQGSLEAIKDSLLKIPTDKVLIQFVSEGLGMITLTDAELAMTSNAVIFGFHTKTDKSIESFVRTHKIKIHHHDVIYHLVDDAKELMTQLLDKLRVENEMSEIEVLATFKASNLGVIAGCMVTSGSVKRNHIAKVYRDGEVVFDGEIQSLKRVKEDVKEVQKGLECGILLKGYNDIQVKDIIKTFEVQYIQQEL